MVNPKESEHQLEALTLKPTKKEGELNSSYVQSTFAKEGKSGKGFTFEGDRKERGWVRVLGTVAGTNCHSK